MLTVHPEHWPADRLIEAVITVVWLIGITNAINFLDGVDGLADRHDARSVALLFFLIAWPTRQSYLSYLTIAARGRLPRLSAVQLETGEGLPGRRGLDLPGLSHRRARRHGLLGAQ